MTHGLLELDTSEVFMSCLHHEEIRIEMTLRLVEQFIGRITGRSRMSTSTCTPQKARASADHRMPGPIRVFNSAARPIRAAVRTTIFFLKVLPMLPSKPVNWVTSPPVVEHVQYPTHHGQVEGE